ncbi:MAG: hypothetical protein JWM76_4868, partial [Pseudonocardiales bacterium]|nr:hypothetical protein [Pseudonocardiales bacterium]MCW2530002.1 hypothetical protein [Pseudonocardiales bacterium]MCW2530008.1 hypothetical protein [Pseudonocardiales bacterium]
SNNQPSTNKSPEPTLNLNRNPRTTQQEHLNSDEVLH